jgi:hypothetical protein
VTSCGRCEYVPAPDSVRCDDYDAADSCWSNQQVRVVWHVDRDQSLPLPLLFRQRSRFIYLFIIYLFIYSFIHSFIYKDAVLLQQLTASLYKALK